MALFIKNATFYTEGKLKLTNYYMDDKGVGVFLNTLEFEDEENIEASELLAIPKLLCSSLNKNQIEECKKDWKVATLKECLDKTVDINEIEIIVSDIDPFKTFVLLYSEFVRENKIALEDLIDALSYNITCALDWDSVEIDHLKENDIILFAPKMRERITETNFNGYTTTSHYAYGILCLKIENGIITYRKNC